MANMKARSCTVAGFGVIHMLISLVMIVCGILLIVWDTTYHSLYTGILGGIWVLTTGILGVIGGVKRSKGAVIAFMVLSILTTTLLSIPLIGLNMLLPVYRRFFDIFDGYPLEMTGGRTYGYSLRNYVNSISTRWVLVGIGAILFALGIASASFACCLVCRCCGATDNDKNNKIEPLGTPETTVITYKCANCQQQTFQPLTNNQPIIIQPNQFVPSVQPITGQNQSISVQPDQFGQYLNPQQLGQQPHFQPHFQQFTNQPNLHNPTNFNQQPPMFQGQQQLKPNLNPFLQPHNQSCDQQQSIFLPNQLYPQLTPPPPQYIQHVNFQQPNLHPSAPPQSYCNPNQQHQHFNNGQMMFLQEL